jgi:hypothetical protein
MMFCRKLQRALCFSALRFLAILALSFAFTGRPANAPAATPAALCAQTPVDDTLHPIPENLVRAVNKAFGTSMPAGIAVSTTVYRCDGGRVQVCTVGANLLCGKADTNRTPGAGLVGWCRKNPDADYIPMVVTGHATIFDWSCAHGEPKIERQIFSVDARGFVIQFWRQLP